jgi:hypothetical protein
VLRTRYKFGVFLRSLLILLVHKIATSDTLKAMEAHTSFSTTQLAAIKPKRHPSIIADPMQRTRDMESEDDSDASTIVVPDMEPQDDLDAPTRVPFAELDNIENVPPCSPDRKREASASQQLEQWKRRKGRHGPMTSHDIQDKGKANAPETASPAVAPAPVEQAVCEECRSEDGHARTCDADSEPQSLQYTAQETQEAVDGLMNLQLCAPVPEEPVSHSMSPSQGKEIVKHEPLGVQIIDPDTNRSKNSPLLVKDNKGREYDKDHVIVMAYRTVQRYKSDRNTWHRRYWTLRREWDAIVKKEVYCLRSSASEINPVNSA